MGRAPACGIWKEVSGVGAGRASETSHQNPHFLYWPRKSRSRNRAHHANPLIRGTMKALPCRTQRTSSLILSLTDGEAKAWRATGQRGAVLPEVAMLVSMCPVLLLGTRLPQFEEVSS